MVKKSVKKTEFIYDDYFEVEKIWGDKIEHNIKTITYNGLVCNHIKEGIL